jgi:1-acyl-sn-glycerol-3-phosphate acyltransferase
LIGKSFNAMKHILARFFALYALLLFVVTMLPLIVFLSACKLLFDEKKFTIILHQSFRVWMGIFMPMIGCPVKVSGKHFFKPNQQYVVVINHNSLLDIPVSSPGIPGANKTLGKSSFAKTPLFGFIYKAGSILVDRTSAKSRAESYNKMIECLQNGLHLCLYPEGTRNKTNEPLQRFHDGAFKVAIQANAPIMPAIIKGTKEALPVDKLFWLWPHQITFEFLLPIDTTDLTINDVQALKQKVWDKMSEKL